MSGAASYVIQVDNSSSFTAPLTLNRTVTAAQFTTSSLPKAKLSWRVRAIDSAGNPGAWSSTRALEVR